MTPVHRSVEHSTARRVFDRLARDPSARSDLRLLAVIFVELQSARHTADYDPGCRYSRQRALDFIARSRLAIETLRAMPKEDRLILVVQLITKPR